MPTTPRIAKRRPAYTLLEIVAALGSSTILMTGLASSLFISARALTPEATASADAKRGAQVLSKMMSDLRHARRFTERTATAVTFTVPDRDGDKMPETIRYSWTGTTGDPLLYKYNNRAAVAMASAVQQFALTAVTRVMPADGLNSASPPVVFQTFTEAKQGNSATAISIPAPSGVPLGKLLVAVVSVDGNAASSLTAPAGWNLLSRFQNSGAVGMGVWWKIAAAGEPTSYSFGWTGNQQAYGWIMRFAGADPISPINAFATNTGTSFFPSAPGVSSTVDNCMVVRICAVDTDNVYVNASGVFNHTTITMDRSNNGGGAVSGGAAYMTASAAGSIGAANFIIAGFEPYATMTIAISPEVIY